MTQKLKKTRILVAGAEGFIGSHMIRLLQEQPDNEVIPIDLDLLDLSETSAIDALPTEVDYCYHFAATLPTWKFYELPEVVLSNDLRITLNLSEWAARGHCRKILYNSSNEVYLDSDVDEDADLHVAPLLQPRTSYQLSKITSEAILQNTGRKGGFDVTVFRLSNAYGPQMHEDQVIRKFLDLAGQRSDPFIVGGFDVVRQFIHVSDVVRSLWELRDIKAPTINILGDELRLEDLANLICNIAGYAPRLEEAISPPGSAIVKRMKSKYDLPALTIPIEKGLKTLYESLYSTT